MDYFAGGSLATFTSRTILPVSSTMQTLVVLTETSSPAKWSMLRFSDQSEHRTTSGNAPARAQSLRVSRAVSDPGRQGAPRAIDPRPHGAARPRSSLRRTASMGGKSARHRTEVTKRKKFAGAARLSSLRSGSRAQPPISLKTKAVHAVLRLTGTFVYCAPSSCTKIVRISILQQTDYPSGDFGHTCR
jgi:hypothetical protein